MRFLAKGLSIFVVLALFAVPATAQDMEPEPVEVELTDEEKEAIATAYVDLQELQAQYREEFADLQDPEEAQQVQQQFQQEQQGIIEDSGISLELYDQAIQATQTDAELRDELLALIEEEQEARNTEAEGGNA
ncbi:MAG: DUF4168 domain-containing protein [Bacteroidetes bacterium]|jgi:hypothetical protein|nr:DUF4168 domain-containing protein [Bacteroidota bacterium]